MSQIKTTGFLITYPGDKSVGMFQQQWQLSGEFQFDYQIDLDIFKRKIAEAFEFCSDTPISYTPAPTDVVTPEWITEQMKARGLKTVDVARALGIDAASVSAIKNGVRPLSGVGKAAFYYYLNNELKMERGFPTHTQDINGQTIKLGDIVGYDFDDDSTVFEVIFEENAFRKLYKKWDKLLPKPLLEYGDNALKIRLKIVG